MNDFKHYLETVGEFGIVERVNHPIVGVSGLPLAKPHEIVVFESGQLGEVFTIDEDGVEILVFSKEPVRVKSRVVRSNKSLSIPVGKSLLGNTIDPLGRPLTNKSAFTPPTDERELDQRPIGISGRKRVNKPLATGVTVVDLLIPIGKGQKELVIGDRKTGKSAFLLAAIKNQVNHGSIAIYAAIGRKTSDIKRLEEFFVKQNVFQNIIIVATSSFDSPSLIYLTPYTAMTIAEYFRDQGNDVIIVLDDLSTHAKFYREISLLARRFPGRDSYPGDIFYTHARLLERAGNFHHAEKGEVSITCLPIVETVEGDFTGYIVTNLMGITDGHIFFDSNVYYQGRRPAINAALSVTRVGKQTQPQMKRDINRELTSFLALYEKMQNFSHFGAELTASVKDILKTGDSIYKFFDQSRELIIEEQVQLMLFAMLWAKIIDESTEQGFSKLKGQLTKAYEKEEVKKLFTSILDAPSFNSSLARVIQNRDQLLALCKDTN